MQAKRAALRAGVIAALDLAIAADDDGAIDAMLSDMIASAPYEDLAKLLRAIVPIAPDDALTILASAAAKQHALTTEIVAELALEDQLAANAGAA